MVQYSLEELNQMEQGQFTEALGNIFEHTPAIAQLTWPQRPFVSIEALHQVMTEVMQSLSADEQLALIRAHPDLGTKAKMTDSSVNEQSSVGLNQLSAEEFETFHVLNQAYRAKFQFPFIVAVKEHTKASILQAFRERLTHDLATERQAALTEIAKIAGYRLNELVYPH